MKKVAAKKKKSAKKYKMKNQMEILNWKNLITEINNR